MGISALSFTGMKKKASTITSAAIIVCARADFSSLGIPVVIVMTTSRAQINGVSHRRVSKQLGQLDIKSRSF